jgi:hypothetical protein
VLFQLFAPQGLKGTATAIQCIHSSKIGMPALQITKAALTGRYTCVFGHIISRFNDTLAL